MPFKIIKSGKGYKVSDGKKTFSTKALPLHTAQQQRVAIAISEAKKTHKPVSSFFAE